MAVDRNGWATRETLGLLAFSLLVGYVVFVMADLALGVDILRLLAVLFALYLFYRLVVAIELIAEKL